METKVITGKVRLSYAKLIDGELNDQGVLVWGTSILIPKDDKATLTKIKNAVDIAVEEGKSLWQGKVPANLKKPLRDGDVERPDDDAYRGHYFLNASARKIRPKIAKPIGKAADGTNLFAEITDDTEIYSGCYAKVSLNFFPYNSNGNKGVGAGLNSVVKVQDGEPLGGARASVESDFADEDFDTEVDTDDFMG